MGQRVANKAMDNTQFMKQKENEVIVARDTRNVLNQITLSGKAGKGLSDKWRCHILVRVKNQPREDIHRVITNYGREQGGEVLDQTWADYDYLRLWLPSNSAEDAKADLERHFTILWELMLEHVKQHPLPKAKPRKKK